MIGEYLNLSSPTEFNDIFDSPILEFMNNGGEIQRLIREAYIGGVRIACFVKNNKLPYSKNFDGEVIRNENKNQTEKAEFLNELMWAHYADSHKGICIKYNFPLDITASDHDKKGYVSFMRDVEYTSDLEKYSNQDKISTRDAFFTKSLSWKYENELRLLYYNHSDCETFISLPIPNCVEAVYFGVKCPEKEKQTIRNILKGRTCITTVPKWVNGSSVDIKEEKEIKFYQMIMDEKVFGAIKARREN